MDYYKNKTDESNHASALCAAFYSHFPGTAELEFWNNMLGENSGEELDDSI